jgi:hypothetical protein
MNNIVKIFQSSIANRILGKDLQNFILTQKPYLDMMQKRLDNIHKNKKMLKDSVDFAKEMLKPNGFTDKMSIAYMPFKMIDNDLKYFEKYKEHTFVIINPLNGSMCESVRKSFPKSKIICVDTFGMYHKDLTKRGYQCYTNIGEIPKMKKRPVLLINAPYTNGQQDATSIYGEHIKNAITKLNPIAVLNIAPDNLLSGSKTNEKLRNWMIAKYGKPTYIRWLNQNTDWNKTIDIDTSLSIWDEKNNSIETNMVGRFDNNSFQVKLTDLIMPVESAESYKYISRIQTVKKCTVRGFKTTGNEGKQIKLSHGDKFKIVDGEEFTSNNDKFRQVAAYMRTKCLADVPPGPSVPAPYRELVCDYSPTFDEKLHKKFGKYMRSGHTRWLVKMGYSTRSLDSPALRLVPMIDMNDLPDNFTDADLYKYFDTPQTIINNIIDLGEANPY